MFHELYYKIRDMESLLRYLQWKKISTVISNERRH
jgi:hypothetical protein